jgi:hypothetical protein
VDDDDRDYELWKCSGMLVDLFLFIDRLNRVFILRTVSCIFALRCLSSLTVVCCV